MIDRAPSWHNLFETPMRTSGEHQSRTKNGARALFFVALVACVACDGDSGDEPVCDAPEDSHAIFAIDVGDWPGVDDEVFEIEVGCTVDDVSEGQDTTTTALSCDDAGTSRPIVVETPSDPGPVPWHSDDAIDLSYEAFNPFDVGRPSAVLGLRRGDGTLLFAGIDSERARDEDVAPLTLEADEDACGGLDGSAEAVAVALTFSLDGESVTVYDHQTKELAFGEAHYSIYASDAYVAFLGESNALTKLSIQLVEP